MTKGVYPWNTNEPNNVNEACIHIWRNYGTWNDLTCTWSAYPLCKGAPTTAPTTEPTSDPTTDPTVDTSTDALVSWHCDDSSKLFVSRDNGATWTRQAMFSAPYTDTPVRGKHIGNISIHDTMHYEMDVTVHSFPSGWGSVFHCGTIDTQRSPGIWMHPTSGTPGGTSEGFHTRFVVLL